MNLPLIIQGGMGVGVSDWRLARAVSLEGELGVVSGTGINSVIIRRLQRGDPGAHVRRALMHFPHAATAEKIIAMYFVEGGIADNARFKLASVPSVNPTLSLQRLYAAAAFAEVWLAKEGHNGFVGINFLEKLQTSNLPCIYGAMLAGVDYVLMGAGVPREIPGVLDAFALHRSASIKAGADIIIEFDPQKAFPSLTNQQTDTLTHCLKRPKFIAIVSSATLATHLATKSNGRVDGFVVEGVLAGGHNAPPRGQLKLNERGEPIYSTKDEANIEEIRNLGLPFWLAGSFGSPEKLIDALNVGATGIQVGTAFAFCNESGLTQELRSNVLKGLAQGKQMNVKPVFTDPKASPTGFPFKVVQLEGTLSEHEVYEARPRKCDVGYLRQIVVDAKGDITYMCPAEPVEDFVRKGGAVEDTIYRKCLCNALLANIGLGQVQDNEYHEPPLLTAGDDLSKLNRLLKSGRKDYSAAEVLEFLKRDIVKDQVHQSAPHEFHQALCKQDLYS